MSVLEQIHWFEKKEAELDISLEGGGGYKEKDRVS